MQIHRYGYGIRGFGRLSDYGLRFLAMVSEKAQDRYRYSFGRNMGWKQRSKRLRSNGERSITGEASCEKVMRGSSRSMRSPGRREKAKAALAKRDLRRDQAIEDDASQSQ